MRGFVAARLNGLAVTVAAGQRQAAPELKIPEQPPNRGFVAAHDPDTGKQLWYWGVGNGYPWLAAARPGDNLYTASTLALDPVTGAIKGYYQYTPNESWDFDEVSPPMLVDYKRSGDGSETTQAHLNRASRGNFPEVPEGGVIWVFAISDK